MDLDKEELKSQLQAARLRKQDVERDVDNKLLTVTAKRCTYPFRFYELMKRETDLRFKKVTQSKIESSYEPENVDFTNSVTNLKEAMLVRKQTAEEEEKYLEQLDAAIHSSEETVNQLDKIIKQRILPLL